MTNCNKCDKSCKPPCGCVEPVLSIEPMADDPSVLRFNVNGKSVWYDFSPVVKEAETCTTLGIDVVNRALTYHGECDDQSISSKDLGSIMHLGDLGDVDASTIKDSGILNYRKSTDCPEGCEGAGDGWVSSNAIDISNWYTDYLLGADADGKLTSLRPPADSTKFFYLSFTPQDKAKWVTPSIAAAIPNDGTYEYPVYLDPTTKELVVVPRSIQ